MGNSNSSCDNWDGDCTFPEQCFYDVCKQSGLYWFIIITVILMTICFCMYEDDKRRRARLF